METKQMKSLLSGVGTGFERGRHRVRSTRIVLCAALVALVLAAGGALAQQSGSEATKVQDIVVQAEKILTPTRQADETVYTGTAITQKGLEAQGPRASTSVYESLRVLPGVQVESPDPYGLAAEQQAIRVRGVRGYLGALTVEGIPNYGGNPIGPRDYIYDMINVESLSVYKGAVPGDIGTGVGSRGGAIWLQPRWPQEDFGVSLGQSLGAHSYTRTVGRVDSGSIEATGTRVSASYSYTEANKWKGAGKIGPRHNVNVMLSQQVGTWLDAKLWFNMNDLEQNLYKALTYQQTRNLSNNYNIDFNTTRAGTAAQDINYYDYNRGEYNNSDVFAVLTVTPWENIHFVLKPYYADEDTEIYQGITSQGGLIQKRDRDIDRKGIIGEVRSTWRSLSGTLGYLYEESDMNISTRNYGISGDKLVYRGVGVAATTGTTYIHSPYAKISGTHGSFDWQAGLKYFRFKDSDSEGYTTPPPDYIPTPAPDLNRKARTYDIWLPTLGVGYQLTEDLSVYASYGRNFIRPYAYMPLVSLYSANRQTFQQAGITLNDLFQGYDMEKSDNFDLGFRWNTRWFELAPTFFYSEHKKLLTTVYDPRVNLSYRQNIGRARGYGLDLETNIFLMKNLTVFLNPTLTILEYDKDITFQGQTFDVKGDQVVDTPKVMLQAGLLYQYKDLELIPSLRYSGKRYGDIQHKEEIDSYTVVDFGARYKLKNIFFDNTLELSLDIYNVFNKKYISGINVFDDNRGGAASYYAGSPFTAIVSATLKF
ncbi:TonB-dependent receptor [Desulfosoma caldarium]|uniref:Iron complex outermembrane receptor protein n=1 Tax=Desulfosoma caldarium TaxID=610254 RepID=A0A3N1UPY5_9BACT|nr:TonB-dependent receptor [Desulfosoma caldarium]ROQ93195.1 iron complex outermembrane receptor protein [Desulfosoma caldarium]